MPKKKKDDEIVDAELLEDTEAPESEAAADDEAPGVDYISTEVVTEAEIEPEPQVADIEEQPELNRGNDSEEPEPEVSYKLTDKQPTATDFIDTLDENEKIAEPESDLSEYYDPLKVTRPSAPLQEPIEQPAPAPAPLPEPVAPKTAPPIAPKPTTLQRKTIFNLKLNELDRNLTDEHRNEWNAIYASFRAKSIMSGTVIGVDQNTFEVTNRETGEREKRTLYTLVIIGYRVKIIIPETELWMPGEERPPFAARAMAGAKVDFVVMEIDREGECAIASRRLALIEQRRFFARSEHHEGDLLTCRVIMVGAKQCSVECHGYDRLLTQRDLTHMSIPDLRENYRTGQELKCVLKAYDAKAGMLEISVKDTIPNPFEGAELRHPVRSRRQAVISGKYAGGVFCTLTDDTICLCLYSTRHQDADFRIGDGVILVITKYDFPRQLMFGRILSKW